MDLEPLLADEYNGCIFDIDPTFKHILARIFACLATNIPEWELYGIKTSLQCDYHIYPHAAPPTMVPQCLVECTINRVLSGNVYTTFAPSKANIMWPSYVFFQLQLFPRAVTPLSRIKLQDPSNLNLPVCYFLGQKINHYS